MSNGWEEDYKEAVGLIGIAPSEFWEMTPHEFNLLCEGYTIRTKTEWRKVALILNTIGRLKKPVTVDQLLGIKKESKTITKEEKDNSLKELKNIFEEG